jgi:hypothetical protein
MLIVLFAIPFFFFFSHSLSLSLSNSLLPFFDINFLKIYSLSIFNSLLPLFASFAFDFKFFSVSNSFSSDDLLFLLSLLLYISLSERFNSL